MKRNINMREFELPPKSNGAFCNRKVMGKMVVYTGGTYETRKMIPDVTSDGLDVGWGGFLRSKGKPSRMGWDENKY